MYFDFVYDISVDTGEILTRTANIYKIGVGWVQKHEKSTANNRESTRIAFFLFRPLDLVVSLLGRVTTLRLIGFA
jgi:hypothetical protein